MLEKISLEACGGLWPTIVLPSGGFGTGRAASKTSGTVENRQPWPKELHAAMECSQYFRLGRSLGMRTPPTRAETS